MEPIDLSGLGSGEPIDIKVGESIYRAIPTPSAVLVERAAAWSESLDKADPAEADQLSAELVEQIFYLQDGPGVDLNPRLRRSMILFFVRGPFLQAPPQPTA